MRKQLAPTVVTIRDTASPRHRIRRTKDGRLLIAGGDRDESPARQRDAIRVQRTGQLMYELLMMYPAISGLQPEYGWEMVYGETADGLMYIGPHRNYPRHLFALGSAGDSRRRRLPRGAHSGPRSSRRSGQGRRGVRLDAMTTALSPVVDLLAVGPHPDDIEIGIGGIVAKHASLGHRVGLCDLTAGEMGSNGTVDERLAEAEAARAVLGAAWRVNLRLPDRAIGTRADHLRAVAGLVRRAQRRGWWPFPIGPIAIPTMWPRATC